MVRDRRGPLHRAADSTGGAVHVARQGLYDAGLALVAHELLFRPDAASTTSGDVLGDRATTHVIVSTFTVFGLHELVGDHIAFVNLTRPFILGELPLPFEPGSTVLELLEDVPTDEAVLAGVRRLRAAGHRIALDDFLWSQTDRHALLPHVDVVKIDISQLDDEELAATVAALRASAAEHASAATTADGLATGDDLPSDDDVLPEDALVRRLLPRPAGRQLLVAERVETLEQLDRCRALGFDLFQGWALLRPEVISKKALEPHRVTCLELLRRLSDPDIAFDQLESIVVRDAALTYRILLAANAAAWGLRRRLGSVRHAMVMLGTERLRGWIVLLVAAADAARVEPLTAALTRARMCELLAPCVGVPPEVAFTLGLLSALDVVLGVTSEELLRAVALSDELAAALAGEPTPLGRLLADVQAYEDWADLDPDSGVVEVPDLGDAYLGALAWAHAATRAVGLDQER
nr:HDOD domain-containing protein [uncultured Actinotalea sp.]